MFGTEGYTVFDQYVYVLDEVDTTNIKSLANFAGETIQAKAGDNAAFYFENYNKENPDKAINLDYTVPSTNEELISYFKSGKWAFMTAPKKDIELYNEAYEGQAHFKLAFDEPIISSDTYFIYKKDDDAAKELQEAVDGALKDLKESGKLSEISIEVWGGDYTISDVKGS